MPNANTEVGMKANPYVRFYRGVKIDVYRIMELYGIVSTPRFHAIKKLIRAGHSHKPIKQDLIEAIESIQREIEMLDEGEPTTDSVGRGGSGGYSYTVVSPKE